MVTTFNSPTSMTLIPPKELFIVLALCTYTFWILTGEPENCADNVLAKIFFGEFTLRETLGLAGLQDAMLLNWRIGKATAC